MQHPIAYCNRHGFFAASALSFAAGTRLTILRCLTSCPLCGSPSEIVPGAYSAELGSMNLLVDASISREALAALGKLLSRVEAGEISPAEAAVEAKRISPKLGGLFDPSTWSSEVKAAAIAAVAYLLGQAAGCDDAPVVNVYPPQIERPAPTVKPDEKYSVRLIAKLRAARLAEKQATKIPKT